MRRKVHFEERFIFGLYVLAACFYLTILKEKEEEDKYAEKTMTKRK